MLPGQWHNASIVEGKTYICGFCGVKAGPSLNYYCVENGIIWGHIYICPSCKKPTFIDEVHNEQTPGPIVGRNIKHLPETISDLYNEARKCYSVNAYTSSVLACRKLLMNVSVQNGAAENLKFIEYVNFLETGGYISPKAKDWVDQIRQKGNTATHEIAPTGEADARQMITFTEILLLNIYEFPNSI